MFQISDFLADDNDDINLIEIFMFRFRDEKTVDLDIGEEAIEKIKKKYFNWKKTEYTVFHKNNMTYQYDTSSDNQVLYTKEMVKHKFDKNNIIISYKYSKLPTYIFPCTDDIDNKLKYEVEECRISNRISIMIKTDMFAKSVYIEYKHSSEAENEKNETILKNTFNNINNARIS